MSAASFRQQLFFYQSYLQQNTSTILVDKQNDRSKILLFWRQISGNKPNLLTKLGYLCRRRMQRTLAMDGLGTVAVVEEAP